jgi:hypothetical protein
VKKYKVSYQWRIPSLIIRGPKDVLHKAKQELETDIQGIIKSIYQCFFDVILVLFLPRHSQIESILACFFSIYLTSFVGFCFFDPHAYIATKTIQLSTYIAAELSKENNSMCKDCFIQSGVLVTFPEIDAVGGKDSNPVMMEINLPYLPLPLYHSQKLPSRGNFRNSLIFRTTPKNARTTEKTHIINFVNFHLWRRLIYRIIPLMTFPASSLQRKFSKLVNFFETSLNNVQQRKRT